MLPDYKFAPLKASAAAEIGRQIDAGEVNGAPRLVEQGFSWPLAFAIARQVASGGNAGILFKEGLSGALAKEIASACDVAIRRREADTAARAANALQPSDPGWHRGSRFVSDRW